MKKAKTITKPEPSKWYKIGGEGELREVKWLIRQGDYKSVDDYVYRTSLTLYGTRDKPHNIFSLLKKKKAS